MAISSPMPEEAPVMRTTLSLKKGIIFAMAVVCTTSRTARLPARGREARYELGLIGGVGLHEEQEDDAEDGENAEGGFFTVPDVRLPHQKPFAADGDEG